MKKIIAIITGILLALFIINYDDKTTESFELASIFDNFEDIRWADIFGPRKDGSDLYKIVRQKLIQEPAIDALTDTARKFGLSTTEAKQVAEGSISALYHNPSRNYRDMSMERVYAEYNAIRNYYIDMKEMYEMLEEMNLIAMTSEIFANGDLSDSGFDLIDDYRRMQKILFQGNTPIKTGQAFSSPLDKSLEKDVHFADPRNFDSSDGLSDDGSDGVVADDEGRLSPDSGDSVLADTSIDDSGSSDEELPIEIFENDICEDEASLNDLFKDYEEREKDEESTEKSLEKEKIKSEFLEDSSPLYEDPINLLADSSGAETLEYKPFSADGAINPAKRGSWGNSFCPGLVPSVSKSGTGYLGFAGQDGFSSLNSFGKGLMGDGLVAGAGAALGGPGASLKIAVCFSYEFIYKTYSSYHPSASCIKCEVDRINESLNKLLSSSLVPNKVTGSYMESAKCKDALTLLIPSLNIIAIPSPVSTPMNYDLISEKNIFEEWNDFIDLHRPFLSDAGKLPGDLSNSLILENSPASVNMTKVLLDVQKSQNQEIADALSVVNKNEMGKLLSDNNLYAREFFAQIRQFHGMFITFQELIKDSTDACKLVESKKDI
jgi:hypothetical protein